MSKYRGLLGWVGGKSLLANRIVELLPKHTCYVEVFGGGGSVLFRKYASKHEVFNDINSDLINLYRVVKSKRDEFIKEMDLILVSREEFDRYMEMDVDSLSDVERAARFFYIVKTAFGAKVAGSSFGTAIHNPNRLNPLDIDRLVRSVHSRIARVTFENLPYAKLIEKYDSDTTVFYLDPPYYGVEDYYGKNIFSSADFAVLADILNGVKGKFIFSINDCPFIREAVLDKYKFNYQEVTTNYSVGAKTTITDQPELLIYNF